MNSSPGQNIGLGIAIPVVLLNLFAALTGIIWLIILGEWKIVLLGVGAGLLGSYPIAIASLPSFALAAAATKSTAWQAASALGIIGLLWGAAVAVGWAFLCLKTAEDFARSVSPVPVFLLSYGAATSVWRQMAKHEDSNPETAKDLSMCVCVGYAFCLLSVWWFQATATDCVYILGVVLFLGCVPSALRIFKKTREALSQNDAGDTDTGLRDMAQFNIRLSDKVLLPDSLTSVRNFAERVDWKGLPSSANLHAGVISVVLRPPDTDTSLAEKLLLLLATQRMIFFLGADDKRKNTDVSLWLGWIERIEVLTAGYESDDYDATQFFKDKMQLSIELMTKGKDLIPTDNCASEVLYASANELSESAEIQTRNTADERIESALAIAELAKKYSFEKSKPTPQSLA